MPVVYIDVLFFINLVMDLILLITTGAVSGLKISVIRLVSAAVTGAVYGVLIFFAPLSFMSAWIVREGFSALMCYIAFGFKSAKSFLRTLLNLHLSTFLLGGGLSACFYLSGNPGIMSNGIYYFPLSLFQLLGIALIIGPALVFYFKKMKNRLLSFDKYCTVTISVGNESFTAEGLIDTGCSLKDPYLNLPVVIIGPEMARHFSESSLSCRLIPFCTINSGGLAKAFSPDLCIIHTSGKPYSCRCAVAIAPEFSGRKIIVNPDVFNNVGGIENDLQSTG